MMSGVAVGIFMLMLTASLSAQSRMPQPGDAANVRNTGTTAVGTAAAGTAAIDTVSSAAALASTGDDRSQVTAFVFRSLDDSTRYISNATVAGKVYLVDFWATWCPPCVAALPDMEKIYEEYHPRRFEIISLSFDSNDDRISQFRAKRFRMPWMHGRLEGGFGDILAITFAVENIPHYVLVGRDSGIIASGDDLHGEKLRGLLDEHLREEE